MRKGQITEIFGSWWMFFLAAIVVIGLLVAIFAYTLIPGAKDFMLAVIGIKG